MLQKRIKVFHLEDYKVIRDGMRLLLSQDHQISIVGDAAHGEQLLQVLPTTDIDVLILDIYLDSMQLSGIADGFEVCKQIQMMAPQVKIIAHSAYDDADRVSRIMNAGALGFVSKKSGFEELLLAIKTVNNGGKYICRSTAKKLKNATRFLAGTDTLLEGNDELFTRREREVLELLAEGYSTREIAQKLFITDKTVESHRKNLVSKAKVRNTVELIAYASSKGIIRKQA